MGDSSSFSSLFALVDNHLSRSNIQEGLPTLNGQRQLSDNRLTSPCLKLSVPSLTLSDTLAKQEDQEVGDEDDKATMCVTDRPIHDVLSIQLSNMFKAREAKEEEKRKQEELNKAEKALQKLKLEESSCLIDLMPAVQRRGQVQPQHVEILSSGSSMESIVIPDILDEVDDEPQIPIANLDILGRPASPKPILQDISYILKHKIGKCSQFGKVLCARYRPVAAPYLKTPVPHHNIKVFDFSTPSPDDLILEQLKKPTCYAASSS